MSARSRGLDAARRDRASLAERFPQTNGMSQTITDLGSLLLLGFFLGMRPATDLHAHAHAHGDYVHHHAHGHGETEHGHGEERTPVARLDRRLGSLALYRWLRPLLVGVVHGLAGSAAVALLVLTAVRDPGWA